jgi:hypothetical protein
MPTTFRRLLLAIAVGSVLWLGPLGSPASAVLAPTPSVPVSSQPGGSSPLATPTPTPSPPEPEERTTFEKITDSGKDGVEWVKENVAIVIVVVGLVLLFGLWKFVSRPAKNKF